MTDITIPLKAVGAAAVNVAAHLDWHDWLSMDEADRALCRRIATAALRAGIAAWPGMLTERRARCDAVVLPFNLDADIGDAR